MIMYCKIKDLIFLETMALPPLENILILYLNMLSPLFVNLMLIISMKFMMNKRLDIKVCCKPFLIKLKNLMKKLLMNITLVTF
jgi:hypothetical protein